MKIGIIGAMNEEIELYLDQIQKKKATKKSNFTFYEGKLENKKVIIVKSGVGKVNATICTQILIDKFKVTDIIFTGVAGAINPDLNIGDVVISRDSVQHDLDAKTLGFEKGQIPFSDLKFFQADEKLKNIAKIAAQKIGLTAQEGRILTGDQFINDFERNKLLKEEFDGDCVDMESAAVAHTCVLNNIPHIIIRSISDKADESASINFAEFCKQAAQNSFNLVKQILKDTEQFSEDSLTIIKNKIRTIPNWPKPGIMFRDITTLIQDSEGFEKTIDLLEERYKDLDIDIIAGIESRGFIFGAALAGRLKKGLVIIRKPGKLPCETESQEYELEYGTDKIEIHKDSIKPGQKVLLIDDLIATGGTCLAATKLVKKLGGEIFECSFVIDLPEVGGRKKLEEAGLKVFSLVDFEGE